MKKALVGILTLAVLLLPSVAFGQLTIDANLAGTFGLGDADLQETVIQIVQWVLGLLGLIAVIMILYGGFVWITAGGNEDKVGQAKKIISAAVVGLIIVLLAWAIVTFVVNTTSNVTA